MRVGEKSPVVALARWQRCLEKMQGRNTVLYLFDVLFLVPETLLPLGAAVLAKACLVENAGPGLSRK